MYYNNTTNELQNKPPWTMDFISPELQQKLYPNWEEVEDNFIPPAKPGDTFVFTNGSWILNKGLALQNLNYTYQPQFLELQTQIAINVSVTNNTIADTNLRSDLADLQAEFKSKRKVILDG